MLLVLEVARFKGHGGDNSSLLAGGRDAVGLESIVDRIDSLAGRTTFRWMSCTGA